MNKLTNLLAFSVIMFGSINTGFTGINTHFVSNESELSNDLTQSVILLPQNNGKLNNTNYKGQQSINSTNEDLEEEDDLWTSYIDVSIS